MLLGNGDGTFQAPRTFAAGSDASSVAVADVNGDGRPDLVTANLGSGDVSVLLGNGDGTFVQSNPERIVDLRHVPHRADIDRDGTPDTVVLNASGEILFRRGLPGTDNQYAPPVIVNPGRPARDLTLLRTAAGMAVAASDEGGGYGLGLHPRGQRLHPDCRRGGRPPAAADRRRRPRRQRSRRPRHRQHAGR